MSENSGIQWTDNTFNPWIGCTHVSPGCVNCYAEVNTFTRAQRAKGRELWGAASERHPISEAKWKEVERWERDAAKEGKRVKVFCASLADVFEDRRDLDPIRARLFALIERTPHLIWQLLTKRPEKVDALIPAAWCQEGWPSNVWLGATVEDCARKSRLDRLRAIDPRPRVLFASFEPLLQELGHLDLNGIGWAIFGGESGRHARTLDLEWIRGAVVQCKAQDCAVFVKQMGAKPRDTSLCQSCLDASVCWCVDSEIKFKDSHGGDWSEWPEDLRVREFPR